LAPSGTGCASAGLDNCCDQRELPELFRGIVSTLQRVIATRNELGAAGSDDGLLKIYALEFPGLRVFQTRDRGFREDSSPPAADAQREDIGGCGAELDEYQGIVRQLRAEGIERSAASATTRGRALAR